MIKVKYNNNNNNDNNKNCIKFQKEIFQNFQFP